MSLLRRIALLLTLLALPLGAAAQIQDFDQLERRLRLKPHQQAQFNLARGATQRALVSTALSAMELKDRLREELGKARPDVGALLDAQEAAFERNRPLFREAGDEWVKLYALLDDDQVAIARRFIEEKLSGLPRLGVIP